MSSDIENLKKQIKEIADSYLGGDLDYKVLITLLFYKALSDKWLAKAKEYLKEFKEKQAYILANSEYYIFYDESEQKLLTWHEAVKEREAVLSIINNLSRIFRLNQEFNDMEVLSNNLRAFTTSERIERLTGIVNKLNEIDFSEASPQALNSLLMWILLNYVPEEKSTTSAEKKGEEFRITPLEVGELLVKLLDINPNSSVLDPALGSGSFLVYAFRYVKENHGNQIMLYGQEIRESIAGIAKINLVLSGIKNYQIFVGDSLANPKFNNLEIDYALTDPRWNQKYQRIEDLKRDPKVKKIYTAYASDGFPPKNSMDWGWIQLLLYFSKKKSGIVIDNGALFRGKKEKSIRKEIVEKDLIETVIQLPPVFGKEKRSGVILIFNKNKPDERRGKILFINAMNEFEKHPEIPAMNRLGKENIEKIVKAYREFKNVEGFARVVNIEEIRKNDYNLNVTLYVMPIEEEEKINLEEELNELMESEKERSEITLRIKEIINNVAASLKGGK